MCEAFIFFHIFSCEGLLGEGVLISEAFRTNLDIDDIPKFTEESFAGVSTYIMLFI